MPKQEKDLKIFAAVGCLVVMVVVGLIIRLAMYVLYHGGGALLILCMGIYYAGRFILHRIRNIPVYSTLDIMSSLRTSEWRNLEEIAEAMRISKGIGTSEEDRDWRYPDPTWLASTLHAMDLDAIVQSRHCEISQYTADSRYESMVEYKLMPYCPGPKNHGRKKPHFQKVLPSLGVPAFG